MIVKFFAETIYRNPSITISLEACSSKPNSKLPRHEMQIEPLSPLLLLLSLVSQFELYIGPRDARANRSSRGHQSSTANEPPPPLLSSPRLTYSSFPTWSIGSVPTFGELNSNMHVGNTHGPKGQDVIVVGFL